jgi:hypothetical protein
MSSQLQVTGEAKIRAIQGPVVANSGVITALNGAASQYVRGDGTLADFPTSSGGGSSVSYYLNSSVSQGTIGGVAYRELSKDPITGAGTDIAISANGYVANYITDANDPDVVLVPGGNFNCEFYFSVNNNTGNPTTYAELYKYDGTTFTLLGTSSGVPESINQGTTIAPYYFAIPVATAALALTDRLAIRIYVNVGGRTVTLHTENGHLCQVVTTLSKGMVSLNNLTDQSQFLAVGTSGTNFAIVSSGDTHTFNLPVASATNTGKLSSTDWTTFNNKLSTATAAATYVPYTGANASVNLGLYSLSANDLFANGNGTNNANLYLKQGTASLLIQNGYSNILATGTKIGFQVATSAIAAYYADLQFSSLTSSRTYTLPDLSGTLALLEGTQTFSGAKTFSGSVSFNSALSVPIIVNFGAALTKGNTPSVSGSSFSNIYTSLGNNNLVIADNSNTSKLQFQAASSYDYTFPAASGTLALTSNLSAYLPLTGGTLTGALTGTSANFSSNVAIGGATSPPTAGLKVLGNIISQTGIYVDNVEGGVYADYYGRNSGGSTALTFIYGASGGVVWNNGGTKMTLTSAGALQLVGGLSATTGTFSSSVTANSNSTINGGGVNTLLVNASSSTNTVKFVSTGGAASRMISELSKVDENGATIDFRTHGSTYGPETLFSSAAANTSMILGLPASGAVFAIGNYNNGPMVLGTNNTERMRITSGGNVLIGTTTDYGYRTTISGLNVLYLRSTSNTNGSNAFVIQNSTPTDLFVVRNDGLMQTGTASGSPYNNTSGAVANMVVNSQGTLERSTVSSLRYKENIKDWDGNGLNTILALKPKTFKYKKQHFDKADIEFLGLIAEEVAEVSPYLADYENEDRTGQVENVRYAFIVVPLIKAVQELEARIKQLENK